MSWNTLSPDTVALINAPAGTAFAGGNPSSFPVKWKNEANTAPIFRIQVQSNPTGSQLFQDEVSVGSKAASTLLSNTGQGWPNMATNSTAAFYLVQLITRNEFDKKIFTDWTY